MSDEASPLTDARAGTAAEVFGALTGFVLLTVWRAPPLVVVAFGAVAGMALAML